MIKPKRTDTPPWWKEPWPWILMAGPFITLIGCIVTVVLAVHYYGDEAIHDGGVRQGLKVQKTQETQETPSRTNRDVSSQDRRQEL